MASRIHCRSCFYDLRTVFSGSCPECGRSFDPADPKTFTTLGKAPSLFVGLLLVIGLAVIAFFSIGFAFNLNYVPERHLAFWVIFGIGLTPGITAGILAALNRFLLVRIAMMFVGIFSVWAGLFLASDKFYRVWQATPSASPEAYADTGPMGALLAGWIPGTVFVGIIYALATCTIWFFGWLSEKRPRSAPSPPPPRTTIDPGDASSNPADHLE